MPVVETPRLVIRAFRAADAPALEGVFCDPDVMRFSDDGVRSAEWIRDWLREWIDVHQPAWGFGKWAVVERPGARRTRTGEAGRNHDDDEGEVIGYCGLSRFPHHCGPDEVEISWRLARDCWGRGYATEAALAVRDHAFETLGVLKLIAIIDPANTASIRVAQKLGMHHQRDVMFDGYTHPDHVYVVARHR